MKRGMITLNVFEVGKANQYIPQKKENAILLNKFNDASQSNKQDLKFLLSEEEAEIIMDSLPMPGQGDDKVESLRKKLQSFLTELRFSE